MKRWMKWTAIGGIVGAAALLEGRAGAAAQLDGGLPGVDEAPAVLAGAVGDRVGAEVLVADPELEQEIQRQGAGEVDGAGDESVAEGGEGGVQGRLVVDVGEGLGAGLRQAAGEGERGELGVGVDVVGRAVDRGAAALVGDLDADDLGGDAVGEGLADELGEVGVEDLEASEIVDGIGGAVGRAVGDEDDVARHVAWPGRELGDGGGDAGGGRGGAVQVGGVGWRDGSEDGLGAGAVPLHIVVNEGLCHGLRDVPGQYAVVVLAA